MKRIASLVLMAIFLMGMASVLPVKAINPTWGIEVYTKATTIGGKVQFAANITQLKPGWYGSEVDTYISTNGFASINPDTDLKLDFASNIYIAEINYTYVEFTMTEDLVQQLLSLPGNTGFRDQPYIYLYIKMTDRISTSVSNRFILILDSSKYVDFNETKLSYIPFNEGGLTTNNAFQATYNLTDLSVELFAFDLRDYNITIEYYIPTVNFYVFQSIKPTTGDRVNTSDVFSGVDDNILTATLLRFNGTLKDFAVNMTGSTPVYGIPINYARFMPALNAWEDYVDTLQAGSRVAFITPSGAVYEELTEDYIVNATRISITGTDYDEDTNSFIEMYFDVFPSMKITATHPDANTEAPYYPAGPTGPSPTFGTIMNPGDTVDVEGHNFPTQANVSFCLFAFTGTDTVEKIYEWPFDSGVVVDVNPDGSFSETGIELPLFVPYGAREIILVPKTNTSIRGLFDHVGIVYPYIVVKQLSGECEDGCMGFDKTGQVALGEYLLVKGYGFNVGEEVTIEDNATGVELPGPLYAGSNIADDAGAVIFITRMPYDNLTSGSVFWYDPDYREYPGCPVCWLDYVYTAQDGDYYTADIITDGSRYFIFMEPEPFVNASYDVFDGCIQLSNITKYPHKAYDNYMDPAIGWVTITEDEVTVMPLEIIGVNAALEAVNVSMTDNEYGLSFVTMEDVPLTNGYAMVDMPVASEAPCDIYTINVSSTDMPGEEWWSTTMDGDVVCQYLKIASTAAMRNLDRGTPLYRAAVYVAVLNDTLSIAGYGWKPSEDISVTVYWYNRTDDTWVLDTGASFTIDSSDISEFGSFNISKTLDSSIFMDNSIYKFELSQADGCGTVDLFVYINITPTLFVELKTGHAHVPGGLLNIFVKPKITALPPDVILSDYEFENLITIYYFDGTSWVGETLTTPDTTLEGYMVFTWHIPDNVVGGEVLVKAYVTAYNRWAPDLIRSSFTAYDTVSIMTKLNNDIADIKDMLANAQEVIVNSISEGVANITALINDQTVTLTASLSDIQEMLGSLDVKVTNLQTAVDLYGGQVLTALNAISDQLTSINVTITEGMATIETNLGTIQTSLDTIAEMLNETKTVIIEEIGNNIAQISAKLDNATLTITGSLDNITSLIKQVSSGFTLADIKLFITAAKSEVLASIDSNSMQIIDKLDTLDVEIKNGTARICTHLGKIDASLSDIQKALSDLMNSVSDVKATVNTKGDEIITTITNAKGEVIAKISATTDAVNKARADIINNLESAKGELATKIDNAQNALSSKIDAKSTDLSNAINSGYSDTKKSIDNVNSNVTIYGATSVVLLVIALGLAAYGILVRKK